MTQPQGPRFQGPMQPNYQPPRPDPYAEIPGTVQTGPRSRKRFGWLAILICWPIGFVIGVLMGIGGDTAPTTAEPAAPVTVTVTETAPAGKPSAAPTTQAPKPAQPKVDDMIGDGTHEVGVDVQAGQYKTNVAADSFCYWERTKDDSGSFNSIIANDNVQGPARASVTIKRGEFFKSSSCGTWQKVG